MADHLARIFGTEEDKVTCTFYFKIGACRHGERCTRLHMKPTFSQTLLFTHLYSPPPPGPDGRPIDDAEFFSDFFEEVYDEFKKYGTVEEIHICQNLGDHMFGNTYVKYSSEEEAEKAMSALQGRYYAGRVIHCEYSPVTDFREARCRQFDENMCARGGYCNFMHLKDIPRHLRKFFTSKRRSRSPPGRRSYRGGGGGGDRGGGDRGGRDRDRGGGGGDRGGRGDRGDRGGGGGDRGDRRRGRSRSRSRGRDRDRGRRDKDFWRCSSEERREIIYKWNKERQERLRKQAEMGGGVPQQPRQQPRVMMSGTHGYQPPPQMPLQGGYGQGPPMGMPHGGMPMNQPPPRGY